MVANPDERNGTARNVWALFSARALAFHTNSSLINEILRYGETGDDTCGSENAPSRLGAAYDAIAIGNHHHRNASGCPSKKKVASLKCDSEMVN